MYLLQDGRGALQFACASGSVALAGWLVDSGASPSAPDKVCICVAVCVCFCLSVYLSVCLSACLFVCLSACLLACLPFPPRFATLSLHYAQVAMRL